MKWVNVIVLLSVLINVGCSSTSAPPGTDSDDSASKQAAITKEYHIGVDDLMRINVWGNEELSVEVPVRPDGKISMPLIGDVQAGGRTPTEVAKDIKNRLSAYVRNPNVTVMLTELRSHEFLSRIRITGAVQTPLSIPYRQGMTVLDAVLEAGGVNEFASENSTKLYRSQNGKTAVYDIKLGNILNKGELSTNIYLKPGDVITVPERLF